MVEKWKNELEIVNPYKVGYAKTPVHSQFKKGQSGYPGGRKKGSRNFKTLLKELMEQKIELTEQGRGRRVEMGQALLLRAAQDALNGDHKARSDLFNRWERHSNDAEEKEKERDPAAERAEFLVDMIEKTMMGRFDDEGEEN